MRDADHQPLPHTLLWRAGAKQQSNGRRQCGRSNVQSKGGAAHPKGQSIYGKPVAGVLEDIVDWCNQCTGCTGRCTGRCKNCTGRTGRITRGVLSFSNGTARTARTVFTTARTTARTAHTIDLSPPCPFVFYIRNNDVLCTCALSWEPCPTTTLSADSLARRKHENPRA